MIALSTREAAKKLGITAVALSRYIRDGKVPAPQIVKTGKASIHLWTEAEIEHVRKLLPKIANGRKTRYSKAKPKAQPKRKSKP
jgi:predicted DNA-binding transcriptional regulator AlpA